MWMYVKSWDKDNLKIIYIQKSSLYENLDPIIMHAAGQPNGVCRYSFAYVNI